MIFFFGQSVSGAQFENRYENQIIPTRYILYDFAPTQADL